jgi:hypothetical protein
MKRLPLSLLMLPLAVLIPARAYCGAFVFAEPGFEDEVTHARVYTGTGGALATPLTVCLDTSLNPALVAQAEASVIKVVNTFNRLRSIPSNTLAFSANTDIPTGQIDFESTLLHEMGHCQGLAHPNHATESGLADPAANGTKSIVGTDAIFNQAAGIDALHGSADDMRGDDVNLHWYLRNLNNPGLMPALFDTTTLARPLTALPVGHLFAANADRNVMNALGFANTEASMQQGAFFNEAQRHLQRDDEVTLRLARAGLDRIQGTADDYSYQLQYIGQLNNPSSAACNLRIRFDATGFAACGVNWVALSPNNVRVDIAQLGFNSATAWYFSPGENTLTQIVSDTPDPSVTGAAYTVQARVVETAAGTVIAGEPRGTIEVTDGVGGLCTITLAGTVAEVGSCNLPGSAPGARTLNARFLGFAGWDSSAGTAAHTVNKANTTLSISDAPDPAALGANVTVTATLSVVAPGVGTPTGTINVTATNSAGCTIALPLTSCVLTFTASGAQTINASYGSDTNFNGSTATAIGHQTSTNASPTISAIANQTINEDGNTGALAFIVGDAETPAASLTLSATSDNLTLAPLANIVFGGSGANRTVTVTPAANQFGVANISVIVTDANSGTASEPFQLTVNSQNDLPTISAIADLAINEDGNTGALAFTIGDVETAAGSLTLSATSNNLPLVPVASIVFGGSGASRTVTVTPLANQFGVADISVIVTDANTGSASEPFRLTVNTQNDLPTISTIADQTINEDGNTGALGFTVGDVETAAGSLTLSATSDNLALVPVVNVVFGGSGASRTVTVTPVANQFGIANISVVVTDANSGTASEPFQLTVITQNDLPTISAIADQVINEDGNTGALAFTIGDVETAVGSLTLSATSNNVSLAPVANIVFGGSGASRTVTVTPLANQFGVANISVIVTDANTGTASEPFQLTVTTQNDVPTVSAIADLSINEDSNTGALAFTIGDVETSVASLTLSATTDNVALVPVANIVFGGAGASRTVTVTPLANQFGVANISVIVTDANSGATSEPFQLTVISQNDLPTVSAIADLSINEDSNTGALAFTIGDVETSVASLTLSATSSNVALVPVANIVFGGSGASRTVTVTPLANQFGVANISIIVTDANSGAASEPFQLTVNSQNDLPTISAIADQGINEDGNTGALAFIIGDVETSVASLTLSATSDNVTLAPLANIAFGGSGASRTVTVTPAANQFGVANISIIVTDANSGAASEPFQLTVTAQNDLPTISAIADQGINEDGSTGALAFIIGDVETSVANLALSATSDNVTLVPVASIVFGGAGPSRTVTVTPAANGFGIANISVIVTDVSSGASSEPFQLTVTSQNDLPTISAIADLAINEDGNTGALAFTVGDIETAAGSLTLSATSDNPSLAPVASIVFGGSGATRSVTVTPLANQFGVVNISVIVTDANSGTAGEPFQLTVNTQNDSPTVSSPGSQTINEDSSTAVLNVTVADAETAAGSLVLTASSSDIGLVPHANVVLAGSGATRTVQVTPLSNLSGTATITLTITDAGLAAGTAVFDVVVNSVNDAPSFTIAGNLNPAAGSSGLQTVAGFVGAVNPGPNEAGQAVAEYVVTEISDPNGIVSAASISNTGTLSYTLNGRGGSATIGAVLRDNGGTANGGTDVSAEVQFNIVVIATANLSVTKTNLASVLIENGSTRYTIEVRHGGFDAAPASMFSDTVPAGLGAFSWSCAGSGGAVCPVASGNGAISALFDMPIGGVLTYTVDATVTALAGAMVSNTASVTTGTVLELDTADNSAIDSDPVVAGAIFRDGFE